VWELSKAVFQYCVSYFHTYDRLYGSLAGITILVLWLNLTGFSLLLGAEVAALCQEHEAGVPEGSTTAAGADRGN
jgi:membrane protein